MLCFTDNDKGLQGAAAAMNILFFLMLPQEAPYESYRVQNILFHDREEVNLFLSSRQKATKKDKLEEVGRKGQTENKEQDLGREEQTQPEYIWDTVRAE